MDGFKGALRQLGFYVIVIRNVCTSCGIGHAAPNLLENAQDIVKLKYPIIFRFRSAYAEKLAASIIADATKVLR